MTSIPTKVITVDRQNSQYQALVQIESEKYLGSFQSFRFGKNKPFTGTCYHGHLGGSTMEGNRWGDSERIVIFMHGWGEPSQMLLATAVVTSAMLRTWPVKLLAIDALIQIDMSEYMEKWAKGRFNDVVVPVSETFFCHRDPGLKAGKSFPLGTIVDYVTSHAGSRADIKHFSSK